MTLPFTVMPNEGKLISYNERSVLQLTPWNDYYKMKERTFARDIEPLLSEDYIRLGVEPPEDGIAYSGAESNPGNPADKKPNITVLRNWGVFSCNTGGHHQGVPELACQEVYEFHGFGAMVIDRDGADRIELHCLRPGDKVLIPSYCNMTMYTLDSPLITLDFANPRLNESTKDMQKTVVGSIGGRPAHLGQALCMHFSSEHDRRLFNVKLNRRYVNRGDGHGVVVPGLDAASDCELTVSLPFSGPGPSTGSTIYKAIMDSRERFGRIGIDVVECGKSVNLGDMELSEPLWDTAEDSSKLLHRHFKML